MTAKGSRRRPGAAHGGRSRRRAPVPAGSDLGQAMEALGGVLPAGAVGVVLGSGLGAFAAALSPAARIPYAEVPGFPRCRVPGHAGLLHAARVGGRDVIVFEGRAHLYEGASVNEVTFPIRLLGALRARAVLLTTAVGAVNLSYATGAIVLVRDQLNLTGEDPARTRFRAEGPVFPSVSQLYHAELLERLTRLAFGLGVKYHRGVLAGVRGPSYETPAEVQALRALGADVVCMSTVLEAMAAASCGIPLAGIAAVTNRAGAVDGGHEGVLAEATRTGAEVRRLLEAALLELDWDLSA